MLEGARVKPDDRGRQLLSRPVRVVCSADGDLGVHFSQLAAREHVGGWWNGRCVVQVSWCRWREGVVRKERYGSRRGRDVGRRRRGSATAGWRQRGGGQHGPGADIRQPAALHKTAPAAATRDTGRRGASCGLTDARHAVCQSCQPERSPYRHPAPELRECEQSTAGALATAATVLCQRE